MTSPADDSAVTGSPVTVTGTTAPGNTVYVCGHEHRRELRDDDARRPPAADGSFSVPVR